MAASPMALACLDLDRPRRTALEVEMMDRPRIKLGTDDRLLAFLLALLLIGGCVVQPGTSGDNPKPGKQTLEAIAFESFQKRDVVRAEKLRGLKGTKYDGKRMESIAKAGADASQETWEPVAKALAGVLDKLPQDDQAAFDNVLEQLAKGAERAGK